MPAPPHPQGATATPCQMNKRRGAGPGKNPGDEEPSDRQSGSVPPPDDVPRRALSDKELLALLRPVLPIALECALAMNRDPEAAEDLAKRALVKILAALRKDPVYLGDGSGLRGLVSKIVRNLSVTDWKKERVQKENESMLSYEADTNQSSSYNPESVLDEMEMEWRMAEVNKAARTLSPLELRIVKLRYMAGLPSKVIALADRRADDAVRRTLFLGMQKLRNGVRNGDTPPDHEGDNS